MVRADRGIRTIGVAVLGVDADLVYAAAGNWSGVTLPGSICHAPKPAPPPESFL